ncbi:hypothetical protein ACFWA4_13780 [Streptomyces sp. NPDC060011]|uniref:hypothetical protein n=1 Tax=Streptomyces sp. NPDC060011 TaxID=3347037 RepID=UPI0036A1A3C7
MRRQQLEVITLQAVDALMSGNGAEDSRVEFKSEWPDVSKVRQLAGHANSAQGEDIVWIIGIDEKARRYTNPTRPDLATWWSQFVAKFDDGVAPDLTDLTISVGNGTHVAALAFATDRAPYAVKTKNTDTAELEIPWRDGTRTRSAKRAELIRTLIPASRVPEILVAECTINGTQGANQEGKFSSVSGTFKYYLEQGIDEATFFPWRDMLLQLIVSQQNRAPEVLPLQVSRRRQIVGAETIGDGVTWRADGLLAKGPAIPEIDFILASDYAKALEFEQISTASISASFRVLGATRRARLSAPLTVSFKRDQQDWETESTGKLEMKLSTEAL